VRHQLAGILERERLDVDDLGRETRGLHRRLALLHVLGARRHQQHIVGVGVFFVRS